MSFFAWGERDGRGEVVSSNAGFNLPDGSTLSPDAAWVESSRVAALSDHQRERFLPFAPDFLIEILSPSDSLPEQDAKLEQWIANGVSLARRIDPFGGTVAVYAIGEPAVVLEKPDVVEGAGPVAGFKLKVARVWS